MPKTSTREWWITSDALRDVLVETGRAEPPQRVFAVPDVRRGWPVLDNEQVRIGTVEGWAFGTDEACLMVRRTFRKTLFVPTSAIGAVHEGNVILNVPREWIASMDWSKPPRTNANAHSHPVSGGRNGG